MEATIIPTRRECFSLMESARMPPHIRRHSCVVTEVALCLTRLLRASGVSLSLSLVESAGLLHDIAKMRSIETGEDHARLGARMLEEWGYPLLAPIVEEHILLDRARVETFPSESLIVNYADKRVKHDEIVLLDERFRDLIQRYGRTEEIRRDMKRRWDLYSELEEKIFAPLPLQPGDLLDLEVEPC